MAHSMDVPVDIDGREMSFSVDYTVTPYFPAIGHDSPIGPQPAEGGEVDIVAIRYGEQDIPRWLLDHLTRGDSVIEYIEENHLD